jgi:hypothetical protein
MSTPKPADSDMQIVIPLQDMAVLRASVNGETDTIGKVIARIISGWARDPRRYAKDYAKHLVLAPQTRVLMDGETLRSYLRRVAITVITEVRSASSDTQVAADRLGYERTGLAKLLRRLRADEVECFHFQEEVSSVDLLPLNTLVQRHLTYALKACNDDSEKAAELLGVSSAQLNLISLLVSSGNPENGSGKRLENELL